LSVLLVVVSSSTAPPFPVLVPLTAIFVLPAGPLLRMPFAPVLRGPVIVAHGYAQKWRRDELGRHADPGAVVARADVPIPADEGVALPVVLKDVGRYEEAWGFRARPAATALFKEPEVFYAVGNQARCDQVRAALSTPTEACWGPVYFRRQ